MDDVWKAHRADSCGLSRVLRQVPRFAAARTALYITRHMRELREWISEKMRRRTRRGPNDSESTGKSGQELPAGQQAPLRPTYPEPVAPRPAYGDAPRIDAAPAAIPGEFAPATDERKIVMETQPENLGTPPAEMAAVSPKSPRGYVVLTIGLPGSGQNDLVQASGRNSALQRPAAEFAVRRHYGTALPVAGVFKRCDRCCARG